MRISFNKPYLTGNEIPYIYQAVHNGKISGNGWFTQKCQAYFQERWQFKKTLLTTSCTDALEMCSLLMDIQSGDEVIMPSFTFVSTALAFVRQGAKIVFVDSRSDHPGMDEDQIEKHISSRTKALVAVHYAGIACDMDKIMAIAKKYNLFVIEDAAQAIDSYYKNEPLGGIGHFGCFSFHETKNIQSGEGGLLTINNERYIRRAEIIWEKGTNRAEFFRGEADKYSWVDIGSSFLPSDIIAAFLFSQLEHLDDIQNRRKEIWNGYYNALKPLADKGYIQLPFIPAYATNNAHMFYIVCNSMDARTRLINKLKENGIRAISHYLGLHKSPYYRNKHNNGSMKQAERYEKCLLRLPFFYELTTNQLNEIVQLIHEFEW